ncbi:hypothetical protein PIB30_100768 [Stylosanthes scabra]|uniref:Uncharacterized protein n=1 Tax=Stylosanthes scabra TaxID=79078 RepID=A0ABU6RXE5_9FABA|nr:hypothetical protein [Stylosanthes scabra]
MPPIYRVPIGRPKKRKGKVKNLRAQFHPGLKWPKNALTDYNLVTTSEVVHQGAIADSAFIETTTPSQSTQVGTQVTGVSASRSQSGRTTNQRASSSKKHATKNQPKKTHKSTPRSSSQAS